MPAKSKSQQRLFGMVHAIQKGDMSLSDIDNKELRKKLARIVNRIDFDDAEEFASTKHVGLPDKVEERLREVIRKMILKEIFRESIKDDPRAKQLTGHDKKRFLQYIRDGDDSLALRYLDRIVGKTSDPEHDIYLRVRKAVKSIRIRNYNLSTVEGWQKYNKDYRQALEKEFGRGIFTAKQITRALTNDKFMTAMDQWDYLTSLAVKKLLK